MRIKYDDQDDILHIEFSKEPVVKDVSKAGMSISGIRPMESLKLRFLTPKKLGIGLWKRKGLAAPRRAGSTGTSIETRPQRLSRVIMMLGSPSLRT